MRAIGCELRGGDAVLNARHLAGAVVSVVAVVVIFLVLAPRTSAADSFCPPGSGAGNCSNPEGLAVDEASGNVYVVDRGHNRINVFDPAGGFLFSFGSPGAGAGQFDDPTSIAIDNDPSSLGYRHVYVGTDNFRVQAFDREGHFLLAFGGQGNGPGQLSGENDPVAVGPGGAIYVADGPTISGVVKPRIERFATTGTFLGEAALPEPDSKPAALAVDSSEDLYVAFSTAVTGDGIWKYEWVQPAAVKLGRFDADARTRLLAIDGADRLFAFQLVLTPDGDKKVITKYDTAGTKLSRFGYGQIESVLHGLAVRSGTGDLYGSEENVGSPTVGNRVIHLTAPPVGPLIVSAAADAPVGNTKATLKGVINPEGKVSTYHFEYVDEDTYQADIQANGPGHGFDDAERVPEDAGDDASIGTAGDFELHSVSTPIGCPNPATEADDPGSKCLTPETPYRFRLLSSNADGAGNSPLEGQFTTGPAISIDATWSSDVGPDSARLLASVNPLGIPATGHFEYVGDALYQADVEAKGAGHGFDHAKQGPQIDFGSGEKAVTGSSFLSELTPGIYRFRIVVANPLIGPIRGPERVFATQAPALGSPPCPNDKFRSGPSAFLPDCRAYEMVSPVDKENGDVVTIGNINSNPSQLNQSAAAGGMLTYSSFRAFGDAQSSPFTSQYFATRYPTAEHPTKEGWESHGISPPRGINILRLGDTLDTEYRAFSEDLCTGWLRHDTDPVLAAGAAAGYANLYRRDNCGPEPDTYTAITTALPPNREAKFFAPELQGVSADGTHAVFRVDDALTGNANPGKPLVGSNYQCYDASNGKLRLVSVLPNGVANKLTCSMGTAYDVNDGRTDAVSHAISDDGSRVFWTATAGVTPGPGQIYVRIDAKNPTVAVSESVSKAAARFWTAAANGSKAIFTIDDGSAPGEDLYEFDVDKAQPHQIAGEVEGLMGASDDASRIYLVSREALGPGAVAGEPNLYLYRAGAGGGSFNFIATLAEGDVPVNNNVPSPVSPEPYFHTARVSHDGIHLVFMSTASPTGFDNVDAVSEEADAEVYLYDSAASSGTGHLACISCNPSGGRPTGRELLKGPGFGTGVWAAAQIPTFGSQLYGSRVLSADGQRLFFESYEALVSRDSNGRQDVYEWERGSGAADCQAKGAEQYAASAGGCLSLISSGESARDSEFVDASADGSDVFIATNASLVPEDPGLIDIYDARISGGFPPPPNPKAPCEGEACQSPPPPPAELTPASALAHGPGNASRKRCAKGERRVRRKGKAHCVKKQRRHHRRGAHRANGKGARR